MNSELIDIKNKKAQLGDFLSWVSVTLIVFFIMVLFGAGILLLNFQISKDKIDINLIKGNLDYEKTTSMINFYKSHYKSFSDWADDPAVNDPQGASLTQDDFDRIKQKQDILNEFYSIYFKQLNIGEAVIYIYTGDKKLATESTGSDYSSYYPPIDPTINFQELVNVKFFILSKEGNVVGVRYYDDEPLGKVPK
ncbi:MAG: hypothetical protein AABW91_02365 [Nanoarchaeota archaeon]